MNKDQPILTTTRLNLRPYLLADASDVQRLAGDRKVADTTLNIPHPYEDGMAEQWISSLETSWKSRSGITYAITLADSQQLIGTVSLSKINGSEAELGYWIGADFWGNGFCTEASTELLRVCPSKFGIHQVRAVHLARNPASGKVLQKLGFRYVDKDQMPDRDGKLSEIGVHERR